MATMDIFKGGRMGGLYNITGQVSLSNSGYNSSYSDAAIGVQPNSACFFDFYDTTGAPYVVTAGGYVMQHFWFHSVTGQNSPVAALVDGTGRPVIAAYMVSNYNFGLFQNTGTTGSPVWVQLGAGTGFIGANQQLDIDIQINIAASGPHTATLFVGQVQVESQPFTDATVTARGIQGGWLNNTNNNARQDYSQIYARLNGTTVGAKVATSRANAAGTYQQMAGTYAAVSQQIPDLTTVNTSNTVGQKQTYKMQNITVPTGYLIGGVDFWTQFKNDGSAPENLKNTLIIGGTEYDASGDLGSPGLGYTFGVEVYPENPATSVAWDEADWNATSPALESGWTSET